MNANSGVARVLVCDDSPTFAEGLKSFLERDDDLEVVGICSTAEELLRALPGTRPDLVTMDLELPGMDGVSATERVMSAWPTPIMVLSAHAPRGSERAAAALAAGALDAMPKSELRIREPHGAASVAVRRRVKRLAHARIPNRRSRMGAGPPPSLGARQVEVIGVCSSTGGPHALAQLLGELPAAFPLPVLVVQHMTAGFTEGLVRLLSRNVAPPVRIASDGAPLEPGVTFAADGAHLTVNGQARLAFDLRDAGHHRPSGDVLLHSLVAAYGARAAAVVLTGIGRDGADGLGAVVTAGGLGLAQDAESSAVYGMPRVARERGAEHVLPPRQIGHALASLVGVAA